MTAEFRNEQLSSIRNKNNVIEKEQREENQNSPVHEE